VADIGLLYLDAAAAPWTLLLFAAVFCLPLSAFKSAATRDIGHEEKSYSANTMKNP
jgi:hypothetical protein